MFIRVLSMLCAIKAGDRETFEHLHSLGVGMSETDNDGNTPLHIAAATNRVDMARPLVFRYANVIAKNERGDTPLHVAVASNSVDVAMFLLEYGVRSNIENNYGDTPLHLAAANNNVDMARILVKRGSNVNETNA